MYTDIIDIRFTQNMLPDFIPQFNRVKSEGDKFLGTSFTAFRTSVVYTLI